MTEKKLIDETLPIKQLSEESVREKNIRRGHISTLHIWWARRPLVAARAVILASLLDDPQQDAARTRLVDFLRRFCRWESSNDPELVRSARQLISEQFGGRQPAILDCFAGGGAIPLEAMRIGCQAYTLELNPVAVLIEYCTLNYPQKYGKSTEVYSETSDVSGSNKRTIPNRLAHDVDRWGKWAFEEARKELTQFYPQDPDGSKPLAYLWARTVLCPNPKCQGTIPLLRQLWLANKGNVKISLRMVPDKTGKKVTFRVVEDDQIDFDPRNGTVRLGSVECPLCRQSVKGTYVRDEATARRLGQQLTSVVIRKPGEKRKRYREVNERDLDAFRTAKSELEKRKSTYASLKRRLSMIPDEPISRPPGASSIEKGPFFVHLQLVNYGINAWGDLLNERQGLALVTFIEKVRIAHESILAETGDKDYAKAVSTYLAFAIDRFADYNTSLTRWDNTQQRNVGMYARQAIAMVWDYAELNPLERVVGAFLPMLNSVTLAITKLSETNSQAAVVSQGTATKMPFPSEFFDGVITDPPYYDAVPYSDLSDFFYVILKRSIGHLYPELFATPLTPKAPEIVQNNSLLRRYKSCAFDDPEKTGIKDKTFFERQMIRAFQEANRVLKPNAVCTVVFAHKSTTAWESLITALLEAGFAVTSSWPIHTEQKQRLRAKGSAALASSVWLTCRKRKPDMKAASWKTVQVELNERVKNRLDFFISQGIKGADALLSAIGPALEVFGRYECVEKVTGERVTTAEFLDKVREAVSYHALSTVLSSQELGKVDPPTAFYVLWKWTYESSVQAGSALSSQKEDDSDRVNGNGSKAFIPFDDALKLARSVGAEIETLLRIRLLEQKKEHIRLLNSWERKDLHKLGETAHSGGPPCTIDMVHRALILWASQEQGELDEYLQASGASTNEAFWKVAQALSNLLPLESKEKQLLDGLLTRHSSGLSESEGGYREKTLDQFMKGDM